MDGERPKKQKQTNKKRQTSENSKISDKQVKGGFKVSDDNVLCHTGVGKNKGGEERSRTGLFKWRWEANRVHRSIVFEK